MTETSYQPVWRVSNLLLDHKSPEVIFPNEMWWVIWDIPTKEYTKAVEMALKRAFELGYRAHLVKVQSEPHVKFKND